MSFKREGQRNLGIKTGWLSYLQKKKKLKEYLWASQWECTKKFKTHTLPLRGLMEWPGFHYTVTDQFLKISQEP